MSTSPWGKIGAWAEEAERAEEEERQAAAVAAAAQPPASFPSLEESVNTAKQKKKTKMTLQEFTMQQSAPSRGLTHEELLRLPTGPKERSEEEMQHGRLGGGFSNYGSRSGSGGGNTGRARDYEGRRSYGFEDDDRRGGQSQSRVLEMNQPSRADEVDNWASMKKPTLPDNDSRQSRPGGKYSSLGGPGGASRADEIDNWASTKKPMPQTPPQTRSSSFGSGFSGPESDRWGRNEQSFGSGFSRPEPNRWTRGEQRLVLETPKLVSDTPRTEVQVVKVNKPNPFGAARPREEILAEKGLDWKKLDMEIEVKKQSSSVSGGSRPTSAHSSRPESAHSSRSEVIDEGVVRQKPKVNPFGDAKPREVLLEEKGLDWKKIDLDLEHRRVDRPETEEEKNLKQKIEYLKNELLQKTSEEQTSVRDLINQKEKDLDLLVRQLDDKVRYSQKIFERPSSGSGRGGSGFQDRPPSRPGSYEDQRSGFQDRSYDDQRSGFSERPPSRPGAYEDQRPGFPQRSSFTHGDYNERPRSRGNAISWSRNSDDRRSFQSGGGRGFLGSRDVDRSGSRW